MNLHICNFRSDLALLLGARIHVPYHSSTYSYGWPIVKVFGLVVWQDTRTPRELIKPETLPGNCWPLEGERGYVVIKVSLQSISRIFDSSTLDFPEMFIVKKFSF